MLPYKLDISTEHIYIKIHIYPYWNDMIRTFRSEMPRRKHRRHMRQYDTCFTGSEAVTWLLLYLRSNHNFGPHITRIQTVQLLHKFHKSGVFEDVRGFKSTRENFQDDGRLYEFLKKSPKKASTGARSPLKVFRPPLAPIQSHLVINKNSKKNYENPASRPTKLKESVSQLPLVRKSSVREKIQSRLKLPSLDEVLDTNIVNPQDIINNSYRIGKTGVVTLRDKTEDLPHWVTSAMKCLIKWPSANGSSSCQPNYPGFERDVFRVLVDYFNGFEKPLISYEFFHLFVTIFIRGEYLDQEKKVNKQREDFMSKRTHDFSSSVTSINNLISDLTLNSKFYESTPVTHKLDDGANANYVHYNMIPVVKCNKAVMKNSTHRELPPHSHYETAFEHETPITRIVQNPKLSRKCLEKEENNGKSFANQSISHSDSCCCSNSTGNLPFNKTCSSMHKLDSMTRSHSIGNIVEASLSSYKFDTCRRSERRPRSPVECNRNFLTVRKMKRGNEQKRASQRERNRLSTLVEGKNGKSVGAADFGGGYINHGFRILSQEDLRNCNISQSSESSYHTAKSSISPASFYDYSNIYLNQNYDILSETGQSNIFGSPSVEDISSIGGSPIYQCSKNMTCDDHPIMTEAMALGCLLLPSVKRRHLHLLFRVINKMSSNEELCLDPVMSNKDVALQKLSHNILNPENQDDYDGILILRIINFLLENCESIFKPHTELKSEVEESLIECSRVQHLNMPFSFCERISSVEFEGQKQVSQNNMLELLDGIISNRKLSEREKKKKLLQFKEIYPDVYSKRFPDDENTVDRVLKTKLKSSKPQLLTRIKSIRI
ncbi:DEP domain-containing protein 1A [Nymphon striatum]|nr:DEP domain-containing protein 1A [Nymphon striatum]